MNYEDILGLVLAKSGGSGGGGGSWMGQNPELIAEYPKEKIYLKDTDFATWTPSNTATQIIAESTLGTLQGDSEHDYIGILYYKCVYKYNGEVAGGYADLGMAVVANFTTHVATTIPELEDNTCTFPSSEKSVSPAQQIIFYNTSLTKVLTNSSDSCIYPYNANIASLNNSNLITIKRPKIMAKCYSTYFSTTAAANIDQNNSYIEAKVKVYKVDKQTSYWGQIKSKGIVDIYNNGVPD